MKVSEQKESSAKGAARTRSDDTWATVCSGELEILQAKALAQFPWLVHGFSTRLGGMSRPEGSRGERALNLGFTDWDTRANVRANRAKLLAALHAEQMQLVTLRQSHSDVVHVLKAFPENAPRGDAAITREPGLLLGVQTADCIPIVLVDTQHWCVAAVHAGWRGTLRRIAGKALGRMQMAFGTRPETVLAVLGPAIGVCCYEVGPEVAQAYAGQFSQAREWFDGPFERLSSGEEPNPIGWLTMAPPGHDHPTPRARLDLRAANRWQLLDAGVRASSIIPSELCTSCRTDLLFSYRCERARTGRLMGVIGLRPR